MVGVKLTDIILEGKEVAVIVVYHKEKQKQEEFLRNFLLVLNPLSVSFYLLPVNFQDENLLILKNKKQTNKMCRLSPNMTNS